MPPQPNSPPDNVFNLDPGDIGNQNPKTPKPQNPVLCRVGNVNKSSARGCGTRRLSNLGILLLEAEAAFELRFGVCTYDGVGVLVEGRVGLHLGAQAPDVIEDASDYED